MSIEERLEELNKRRMSFDSAPRIEGDNLHIVQAILDLEQSILLAAQQIDYTLDDIYNTPQG